MDVDVNEILNGERTEEKHGYSTFRQPSPEDPATLERIEELAKERLYDGPSGNDYILRLLELVRAMNGGEYPESHEERLMPLAETGVSVKAGTLVKGTHHLGKPGLLLAPKKGRRK